LESAQHVPVIDADIGGGDIAFMAGYGEGVEIGQVLRVWSAGKPNGLVVVKSVLREVSWGTPQGNGRPVKSGDQVVVPQQ